MITQAFVIGLNHLLLAQDWARDKLKSYAGRTARLVAPPIRMTFVVNSDGTIAEAAAGQVDLEMVLPAQAPLMAWRGREAVLSEATVVGAADFADDLGFVLRNLRWDYEEDLSRVVGDIPAHRLAAFIDRFGRWQRSLLRNLGENVAEYVRDEKQALASHSTVGEFEHALNTLRDDLSQLESRIARIAERLPR